MVWSSASSVKPNLATHSSFVLLRSGPAHSGTPHPLFDWLAIQAGKRLLLGDTADSLPTKYVHVMYVQEAPMPVCVKLPVPEIAAQFTQSVTLPLAGAAMATGRPRTSPGLFAWRVWLTRRLSALAGYMAEKG